jgi:CBS domain-containing protein
MGIVANILNEKGKEVFTIDRDVTVYEAIRKMVGSNVGSLLVTDKDGVCGILTERDYLRRIVLEGRTSKTTQVHEVMTTKVICVDPSYSIEQCMAIMTQERVRHLPVMEDSKLVGLVSIGDLVARLSREQKAQIRYLKDYIEGHYPG